MSLCLRLSRNISILEPGTIVCPRLLYMGHVPLIADQPEE